MRIAITGGAGFIGHHLVNFLLEHSNHELILIDGLSYAGNLNRITELEHYDPKRVKFVYHNLRAPINEMVAEKIGEVDYILHLAANSSVEDTIKNPLGSVYDNVVGTVNMLDFARTQKNLKLMLYFSTDEVYGPAPEGVNFDEEAPHKPSNPYSAGKAAGEDYCIAYHVTYKLPVCITNTMNVFGFDQHKEKFIPTVIRCVENGDILPVYANKEETKAGSRFWIYAYDVSDAVLFLLDKAVPGEKYHIVGTEKNNLELAQDIATTVGKELKYKLISWHASRPGHDLRYGMSGAKMEKMGWKLKYGLENAFKQIIDTYL